MDGDTRAKAKQTILHELNTQLQIRAQKIRLKSKTDNKSDDDNDDDSQTPLDLLRMKTPSPPKPRQNKSTATKIPVPETPKENQYERVNRVKVVKELPQKQTGFGRRENVRAKVPGRKGIENYRPGYTWNRGGRIKELRLRCLARKYFHVWKRRTFGRVLPSRARQVYRRRLVSACFTVWYDIWWVARKEWRLSIRAELHNRYRLWNKMWRVWREFTLEQRVKTAKKRLASRHANARLVCRVWGCWRLYVDTQRVKHKKYLEAQHFYQRQLLRSAWVLWTVHLVQRREKQEQEVAALHLWSQHVLARTWKCWRKRLFLKKTEQNKEGLAVTHYSSVLLDRVLRGWGFYVQSRRVKGQEYDNARQVNAFFTTRRFFYQWKKRFFVAMAIRAHAEQIEEMGLRVKCRRVFVHWRFYIELKHLKHQKEFAADKYYEQRLKKTTVSAFKLHAVHCRITEMRHGLALQFYKHSLLRCAWQRWMDRWEEKEEEGLVAKTRKAKHHYRHVMLEKCWTQWGHYVTWRKHRKTQYFYADEHYASRTLPLYMALWLEYTEQQQRSRDLAEKAQLFRRENVLARFFYEWHSAHTLSQDTRLMERMAILHYDSSVTKRFFSTWRQKMDLQLEAIYKLDVACDHYDTQLCKRMLLTWVSYVHQVRKEYDDTKQAELHYYTCKLRAALNKWAQYLKYRKEKRRKRLIAEKHYASKLLTKTVQGWKHYIVWWRDIVVYVNAKVMENNCAIMRRALQTWYMNGQFHKVENQKDKMANTYRENRLKTKVFHAWRPWSCDHVVKKQKTAEKVEGCRKALAKGVVRRAFDHWQLAKDRAILMRLKWEQAVLHYNTVLVNRTVRHWTRYRELVHRKKLLSRQAMWFHNTKLIANYFLWWRCELIQTQADNEKSGLALWQWSLNLQKRALHGWYEVTQEKKRKKARYGAALEEYRVQLLRKGVTKWLEVAGDLAEMRQKYAAQRGAETYYKTHKVVARCASHWRNLTARRKQERGGVAKQPVQPVTVPIYKTGGEATGVSELESLPKPLKSTKSPYRVNWAVGVHSDTVVDRVSDKKQPRARPRKPNFLMDSLKREGLCVSQSQVLIPSINAGRKSDVQPLPLQVQGHNNLGQGDFVPVGHTNHKDESVHHPNKRRTEHGGQNSEKQRHGKTPPKSRNPAASPYIFYDADLNDTMSSVREGQGDRHDKATPSDLYLHLPEDTSHSSETSATSPNSEGRGSKGVLTSTARTYSETLSSRSEGRLPSSTRQLEIDSLPRPALYPSYQTSQHLQGSGNKTRTTAMGTSALHQVEFVTSDSEVESVTSETGKKKGMVQQVKQHRLTSGGVNERADGAGKRSQEHNKESVKKDAFLRGKNIKGINSSMTKQSSESKPTVQLLPPNAFLLRQDGSSLMELTEATDLQLPNSALDTARTDTTTNTHSYAVSNLSSTIRQLDGRPDALGHVAMETRPPGYIPGVVTTSVMSPADELVYIKQQLVSFKETKAKLKKAKEQHGQLTSCLDDQCHDGSHDESLQDEVTLLEAEIQYLTDKVRADKPRVMKLSERVKQLGSPGN